MEVFNVVDLFYEKARQAPEKIALIWKDQKVTFGSFEKSITETTAYFLAKGIKKGDRVMVFVPMSVDLYRIVLALFRIGATAVFLDEWVSAKRLNDCCRLASCQAFIGTRKGRLLGWFVPGLRKIPIHLGLRYDAVALPLLLPDTSRDDIALITFTTGSTGTPKAAIRTHGLLYEQFQALIPLIKPRSGDVCMPVLPIMLLINLGAGITSVIADYKASRPTALKPEKVVDQIIKHGVNSIIASPFFVKKIAGYLLDKEVHLAQIEKIFTGGAPVFATEAGIYKKAFPYVDIKIVYGSTEAEPISAIAAERLLAEEKVVQFKGLKVGKAEDCISVKIIRVSDENISAATAEELNEQQVPQGEIGEIIVSGKHVLRAYLNNPGALERNKIFIGEQCWHRTGDSGYQDEAGELFLTGRCNSLIKIQGKIVSTFMYENYFQTINGVEMGTVMMWKNKLAAIIELKDSSQREYVRTTINGLPEAIDHTIFIRKIPRDPRHNSKIDMGKLEELLASIH